MNNIHIRKLVKDIYQYIYSETLKSFEGGKFAPCYEKNVAEKIDHLQEELEVIAWRKAEKKWFSNII